MKRTLFAVAAVATGIGILAVLPVRLPYHLDVVGRVLPHQEWVVSRYRETMLTNTFHDHAAGTVRAYEVTELIRGDVLSFRLYPDIGPGTKVAAGDTIAVIDSRDIETELTEFAGDIATKQAQLRQLETGQKETVIREAEKALDYAREQYAQQQRITARQRELAGTGFVTEQAYESAKSLEDLYKLAVEMAEARLRTVTTGGKPADIELVRTEIRALEDRARAMNERKKHFTLISPIDGYVVSSSSDTVLVDVVDPSAHVVVIPLLLRMQESVAIGQEILFQVQGVPEDLPGRIIKVGGAVSILRDEQNMMALATIDTGNHEIYPNTIVYGKIIGEKVSIPTYFFRSINSVANR